MKLSAPGKFPILEEHDKDIESFKKEFYHMSRLSNAGKGMNPIEEITILKTTLRGCRLDYFAMVYDESESKGMLKDKPQEMQQAMMRIYKEEKVNPMGGCFPIMIQIPVFIALYWVLLSSVEMRNAPWILWIHDLSSPDPYYILPVVMALTTMLQTALNPTPPDPMQAKLMWFMPLIFSVMFFFFPAGLVLYWITNNILSIAQQWMINTRMGVPPQFNLPKFK